MCSFNVYVLVLLSCIVYHAAHSAISSSSYGNIRSLVLPATAMLSQSTNHFTALAISTTAATATATTLTAAAGRASTTPAQQQQQARAMQEHC
jgi:hypothetical protein